MNEGCIRRCRLRGILGEQQHASPYSCRCSYEPLTRGDQYQARELRTASISEQLYVLKCLKFCCNYQEDHWVLISDPFVRNTHMERGNASHEGFISVPVWD